MEFIIIALFCEALHRNVNGMDSPSARGSSGIQCHCMPDEARDGRNVALNYQVNCWCARSSKGTNLYTINSACLINSIALVVFFLGALAHLLKCAQTNRHTLQLALCGGGDSV